MILIGPGTLLFILLLSFRPIRRFMLWAFILFAVFLVACWKGWIGPPAHAEVTNIELGSPAKLPTCQPKGENAPCLFWWTNKAASIVLPFLPTDSVTVDSLTPAEITRLRSKEEEVAPK